MQVSPINSTNFQGRFQQTPALEKIIKNADRDSLVKFNKILERAAKVDDNLFFRITETTGLNFRKKYNLYELNTSPANSILTSVNIKFNNSFGTGAYESEALGKFLPTLEKIYPERFKTSKEEILAEIKKFLVI